MKFTFAPESRPLEGFTIKRAIYRGGFGEVYYAQSDAGREVALKLLQNNADIELRGVQQCLNLSHPNLVTIFDMRQDGDGDHWIVMEYIAGETLDAVMRKAPQGLPVETVRKWLHGMTDGLAYLHSRGLVHRDMKPANVFMENGIVKIGDVGLSKFISPSRHSAQTQSVGTVHYMAPEVAKGKYGREVDIYGLGIMLYEMLTGVLPFDGESTGEILMKHLSEAPDLSKLPPRLQGVVGKALEKDPKDRYTRIEALQRAFDDAVLGLSPHATEQRAQPRPERPDAAAQYKTQNSPKIISRHKFSFPGAITGCIIGMVLALLFSQAGFLPISGTWSFFVLGAIAGGYWKRSDRNLHVAKVGSNRPTVIYQPESKTPPVPPSRTSFRWANLFGAMFSTVPVSAALVSCLALLKPTALGTSTGIEQLDIGAVGLFGFVTILASWSILLLPYLSSVSWNRKKLSGIHFAVLGAAIGVAAYGIDHYLMVGEIGSASRNVFTRVGDHPLMFQGEPSIGGYMAFFATFLGLRNWQEMVSPFRSQRFSIGAVITTVFTAWFATVLFAFPGEIAVAWGVVIGCVTQLAAPLEQRLTTKHKRSKFA